jgi:hypothetical protein
MNKTVLLVFLSMFSVAIYASDTSRNLPVTLNLGLSSYTANGLGANIELPLSSHFSASVGVGHYGGYAVGVKLYRDISMDGPYVGLGYGMVEFEETYVEEESRWEEDLEYGSFFIVGYRFLKENGDFVNTGVGLFKRPEERDEYDSEEIEGGYLGFTFDLTYGITF